MLDFFGGEILTSGYVENNMEYADKYLFVLNHNLTRKMNGYVPLSRIIEFYYEDESLSFESIYKNNIDLETKRVKDKSTVCLESYSTFSLCKDISNALVDNESYKPFNSPIDMSKVTITSFYGQERIVFEEYNIHYAWDLAAPAKTEVYSVGDGEVVEVRFNQSKNETDKENGAGNYIKIKYVVEDKEIYVTYGHLYPNSNLVQKGDQVKHNQLIATVGTTGYSTGNHLHYEVKIDGNKVDGLDLIDFSSEEW